MWWNIASFLSGNSLDPISGGAGWIGAGLLGAVLCWLLMKHLPDKDKQVGELIKSCDLHVKGVVDEHGVQMKSARADFIEVVHDIRASYKESLQSVMVQHDRHVNELASAIRKEIEYLRTERRDSAGEKIGGTQNSTKGGAP